MKKEKSDFFLPADLKSVIFKSFFGGGGPDVLEGGPKNFLVLCAEIDLGHPTNQNPPYVLAGAATVGVAAQSKPPKIAYFQLNCLFYPTFINFRAALSRRKLSSRVSVIIL